MTNGRIYVFSLRKGQIKLNNPRYSASPWQEILESVAEDQKVDAIWYVYRQLYSMMNVGRKGVDQITCERASRAFHYLFGVPEGSGRMDRGLQNIARDLGLQLMSDWRERKEKNKSSEPSPKMR